MSKDIGTGTKAAALLILLPPTAFGIAALGGWLLMLSAGITSAEFGWPSQTIGFWPSTGLYIITSSLLTMLRLRGKLNLDR